MSVRAAFQLGVCLAVATVSSGCAGARGRGRPSGQGRPFTVTTIGSLFGIQARFAGTAVVQDRWVFVTIPEGAVRTYQRDRQDYWDLRLRLGIASCQDRTFEVISEGRAGRLAPLLGLSRDAATLDTTTRALHDTLRLDAGIPAGTDLARSWIVLILEWPFQSVMATYTIHSNVPLNASSDVWSGRQDSVPGERCG